MDDRADLPYIAPDLRPLARPVDALHMDPRNARVGHDVAGIAASLDAYGQPAPIVALRESGRIIKGNGTFKAALELGWSHVAAVLVDFDEDRAAGFAVADNRLGDRSRFDDAALAAILAELPRELPTGFDEGEVAAIVADAGGGPDTAGVGTAEAATTNGADPADMGPDTAGASTPSTGSGQASSASGPDAAAEWEIRPGDVVRMGRHWLICGDCREAGTWQQLLQAAGASTGSASGLVDGVFTSPPYAEQRRDTYGGPPAAEYVSWFDQVQALVGAHLRPDGSFFVNLRAHVEEGARSLYVYDLALAMVREWDWQLIDDLVWKRQGFPGRFRNRFKNAWEPVLHFAGTVDCVFRPEQVAQELAAHYFETYETDRVVTMGADFDGETGRDVRAAGVEGALPTNVIEAYTGSQDPTAVRYGATFPAALPSFFLRAYSDEGAVWVDPFAGSGTLAVAAELTGRVGLMIERRPEACALAVGRLAGMGLEVEHARS